MAYVLYPVVIEEVINPLQCELLSGKLRNIKHLDMECSGSEYMTWLAASLFGMFLYSLGIPLVLAFLLYRFRNELHLSSVKARIGFLYNGYERRCYYWEAIAMSRKALLRVGTLVPYRSLKTLCLLGLSLTFLGVHLYNNPYDNRAFCLLDLVESSMLWCFIWSMLALLAYEAMIDLGLATGGFKIVFFLTLLVIQIWFIAKVAWGFLKPILIKQMGKRYPNHPLYKKLRANMVHWKHGQLDLSELNSNERQFLATTFGELLERLISNFPDVISIDGHTLGHCIEGATDIADRQQKEVPLKKSLSIKDKAQGFSQTLTKKFSQLSNRGKKKAPPDNEGATSEEEKIPVQDPVPDVPEMAAPDSPAPVPTGTGSGISCSVDDLYCYGVMMLMATWSRFSPGLMV
eukprot:gnl/MRDRNA2_/MRDRNA2_52029_c0_seq2.p1 gnl/MRDRNA2_/MRDRNA2_52029_c0~~gnl/MRDRNA2_/MRDRNA2_52029_c0_seq2.p1  ORF type:complete len:437 (+),score=59.89 gnl/MRDRNA2_/MRDRNA2_52029_c0_seq2:103-1311(+)